MCTEKYCNIKVKVLQFLGFKCIVNTKTDLKPTAIVSSDNNISATRLTKTIQTFEFDVSLYLIQ